MADILAALLLPLPPWVGFWIYRRKGRVGLSYGYFIGGILALLALPWSHLTGLPIPAAQLGGALFGFTLFLQAQREGVSGLRRLAFGVGGATGFLVLLLLRLHLPWQEVLRFWAGALLEALLWLLCSDLAYRLAKGRYLEWRMPLVGAAVLVVGALLQHLIFANLPSLSVPSAVLAGVLLGLVALQQLLWLRDQGAWVEGRGEGLRMALSILDQGSPAEGPALSLGLDPRQPMGLLDAKGRILESNGPFNSQVGLPRHRLRGYALDALFQGGDRPVWDGLKGQLEAFGCATLSSTQVSEDGTFRAVTLQAIPFDRGMALLWVGDTVPGSLALQGGAGASAFTGDETSRCQASNALMALALTQEELTRSAQTGTWAGAARRLDLVSQRLAPQLLLKEPTLRQDAAALLAGLVPRLLPMLPAGRTLSPDLCPLVLRASADSLERIAAHLVLHMLEGEGQGPLTLSLAPVDLGGRSFGLLQVEGAWTTPPRSVFGQGWLRQAVLEAGGLLELDQDAQAGLRPRVYLPVDEPHGEPNALALQHRSIWIVDQDPLAQETLQRMVALAGGSSTPFRNLRHLLSESRTLAPPDALVLERTRHLERFQRALRTFQKHPIPTLVMGMGQPLPSNPADMGLRRLGFLEKPFTQALFSQALLALLRATDPEVVGND